MEAISWHGRHGRQQGMSVETQAQHAQDLDAQSLQGPSNRVIGGGEGRAGRGGGAQGAVGEGGVGHAQNGAGGMQNGANAVQESVKRLSGHSVSVQGGFCNLGLQGGGQTFNGVLGDGALPPLQPSQRGHHKMMGGQQFSNGQGLADMHPHDTYYAEQLLSELAWAQGGAPPAHGQMSTPSSANDAVHVGGSAHAPSQHSPYDFAVLKRDMGPIPHGGLQQQQLQQQQQQQQQRLAYGSGAIGLGAHVGVAAHNSAGGMVNVGGKRSRTMMIGNGFVDQRALTGGSMGHPPHGGAHQDALMELARENLVLKHQLQVASLELTRLRGMCDKYQNDAEGSGGDSKNNQSRYWTDDEHQRFLDAIQKFGHKDVKAIASFVGSRNATQVRTHAQKYFMRLARSSKQGCDGSKKSESNNGNKFSKILCSGSASEIDMADDLPMPISSLRAETAAATAAASGEAGTSAAAAAAFRAAGTSKISSGGNGSGSSHTKGQRGSGSGSQMQQQQQAVPAMHMQAAQGKRSVQKQAPQDEHQPLASHQQRMLQAEKASCKKEAESAQEEEETCGVLSKVKRRLEHNKRPGSGHLDRRRDRDDESPGSRSTGSEEGGSDQLSSRSTTMHGKGHGSSGSNSGNSSNKSCRDLAGSSASGGNSNAENGSSDSARGSRSGSRDDSRAGSDNGFLDAAEGEEQDLFVSAE